MTQTLGKIKYVTTGMTIPEPLFKALEQAREYEPRSHYYSRILSASLKEKVK